MKSFHINDNDSGQRVDKFTAKICPTLPSSLLYKYIRIKRIKVNKKRTERDYRLMPGDLVEMYIGDEFFNLSEDSYFKACRAVPEVVFEDKNIIIVNKPQGMVVHEDDGGEKINTVISMIKKYLFDKGEYLPENENSFAPALCNRIDRNTAGLVIAAKNSRTLRIINEKIKLREIDKYYLCVVRGCPGEKNGVLKNFLVKNENKKEVTVYDKPMPNGKTACTEYEVIKKYRNCSLIKIKLLTGRTHQIRAQMSHAGYPLAGDEKYGDPVFNNMSGLKRQSLCSYKLTFNFKTDSDILSYLGGKTVEIDAMPIVKPWIDGCEKGL